MDIVVEVSDVVDWFFVRVIFFCNGFLKLFYIFMYFLKRIIKKYFKIVLRYYILI